MSEWELRGVLRREVTLSLEAPTLADALERAQAGRYGEIVDWEDDPAAQFFFYGSANDVWVEHPDGTYTWVNTAELPEPWRRRRLQLVNAAVGSHEASREEVTTNEATLVGRPR
ncbi:MAG TPA: hypothetical protein VGS21_11795 [Acidimicrobiales bacterium]|nr:hypothetical protein [Acidimicrobiales bacterium]